MTQAPMGQKELIHWRLLTFGAAVHAPLSELGIKLTILGHDRSRMGEGMRKHTPDDQAIISNLNTGGTNILLRLSLI